MITLVEQMCCYDSGAPVKDGWYVGNGHFSVKVDFTQFRKYRNLCNRHVKHIGVEHPLFFGIRNELQFVEARKVISLEFPPFVKLTQVKLRCRNTIGYGSYMTNVLQ